MDKGKISQINTIIAPIKKKKEQVIFLRKEQNEAREQISQLEKEVSEMPSFKKSQQLSSLKESYASFSQGVALKEKEWEQKVKDTDKELRDTANTIIQEEAKQVSTQLEEEAQSKIEEGAAMILEAYNSLRERYNKELKSIEQEIESETAIKQYVDPNSYSRYPNYSQLKIKTLRDNFLGSLKNIDDNFNKNNSRW